MVYAMAVKSSTSPDNDQNWTIIIGYNAENKWDIQIFEILGAKIK